MKNKIIIVIAFVAFMIAILFAKNIVDNKVENTLNKDILEEVNKVQIQKVTEENFEEEIIKSEKIVLIDFYATWCMPCKILSSTIEEIANENKEIKVVKIDIDESPNLATKYNIVSIPTVVVIQNGLEKDRVVGVVKKEEILSMLK